MRFALQIPRSNYNNIPDQFPYCFGILFVLFISFVVSKLCSLPEFQKSNYFNKTKDPCFHPPKNSVPPLYLYSISLKHPSLKSTSFSYLLFPIHPHNAPIDKPQNNSRSEHQIFFSFPFISIPSRIQYKYQRDFQFRTILPLSLPSFPIIFCSSFDSIFPFFPFSFLLLPFRIIYCSVHSHVHNRFRRSRLSLSLQ